MTNSNELDVTRRIEKSALRSDKYFLSLVNAAISCSFLTQEETDRIRLELFELLGDICFAKTKEGSSSMPAEEAEIISESIVYTVSLCLKQFENPDNAVKALKNSKIEELYYDGIMINDAMLNDSRKKVTMLRSSPFKTDNVFYNSAIGEEMTEFFKNYDMKFAAQKSVIHFDYPVYNRLPDLIGSEFVAKRLDCLVLENLFCRRFSAEKIHRLLCALDLQAEELGFETEKCVYLKMPVNIYSYVLACVLGLEMCKKDIFDLCLSVNDVNFLESLFCKSSASQIHSILFEAAQAVLKSVEANDELRAYVLESTGKLSDEITLAKGKNVKRMFLCCDGVV